MYKFLSVLLILGVTFYSVYAINTLIHNIDGRQVSTSSSSYPSQNIQTLGNGDLRFMNRDNDSSSIGDYFVGYYYDSIHGVFEIGNSLGGGLEVSSDVTLVDCPVGTHDGYKLSGYSYSPYLGFMDMNYDSSIYTYVCILRDSTNMSLESYLGGYAYSPYVGFQNFDNIAIDNSVDIIGNHEADGRYVKVDGNTTSSNSSEVITNQFVDDIRVIGKLTKATFRKDIQQNVFNLLRNITPSVVGSLNVSGLSFQNWSSGSMRAVSVKNDTVLYFSLNGEDIILPAENSVTGTKTIVVEGGNIYISGNIRGSGILGLISLKKDGVGGNIYIDPSVTDVHAIMYADKSLISYDGTELDGSEPNSSLANQLYIYGSIFSENTLGGYLTNTCPFYINAGCTSNIAKKYDLNFIRRYIRVQPVDILGNSVGSTIPQYNGLESYMGDSDNTNTQIQKPGYEKFPLIIEYNPSIQESPPPLFN